MRVGSTAGLDTAHRYLYIYIYIYIYILPLSGVEPRSCGHPTQYTNYHGSFFYCIQKAKKSRHILFVLIITPYIFEWNYCFCLQEDLGSVLFRIRFHGIIIRKTIILSTFVTTVNPYLLHHCLRNESGNDLNRGGVGVEKDISMVAYFKAEAEMNISHSNCHLNSCWYLLTFETEWFLFIPLALTLCNSRTTHGSLH
jgi:hypothetical protein